MKVVPPAWFAGAAALLLGFVLVGLIASTPRIVHAANTTYYVDCGAASNGNGSQSSPWNSLSTVNSTTFGQGDSILFKRGTTCSGMLSPKGSGASGSPITIGAYGTGALPIIDGGTNQAAIKLINQSYWRIQNIETKNGNPFGILITADTAGTYRHFRISNVVVHDVQGTGGDNGGLIFISPDISNGGTGATDRLLDDIVIDGATAYTTRQFAGIQVGRAFDPVYPHPVTNVTIRNSTVYDTGGDGITMFNVETGLIENSVSYETGLGTYTRYTPNNIWFWSCKDCTIQFNEAYKTHPAGSSNDAGAFDLESNTENGIYQYNYGHDNDGYGISVFASIPDYPTTNGIIRYNIFANNGLSTNSYLKGQGDLFISVWDGGSINGLQIYNNTFYSTNSSKVINITGWTTSGNKPSFIKNNIFYSTQPNLLNSSGGVTLNNNIYWYTGNGTPQWKYNNTTYSTFSSYKSGSSQDANSLYQDPKLNNPTYHGNGKPHASFTLQSGSPALGAGVDVCSGITGCSMGTRDFFGITPGATHNIGAYEGAGTSGPAQLFSDDFQSGSTSNWTTASGSWSVYQPSGQSYEYRSASTGDNVTLAGNTAWRNYYLQSYVNLSSENGGVALLGRVQDATQYYQLELKKDSAGVKKWWIWKRNNNTWTEIASGPFNFTTGTYYLLRFDMHANTLSASVSTDWGSTFTALGTGQDSSYTAGKIGLRAWGGAGQFDVVQVTTR